MDPTGSLKGTSKFSKILEPLKGCVHHFHIIHSIASTHHVGPLSWSLNSTKPKETLMDSLMDPKMDHVRLILGDLGKKGPCRDPTLGQKIGL